MLPIKRPAPPPTPTLRLARRILPAAAVFCALGVTGTARRDPRPPALLMSITPPVPVMISALPPPPAADPAPILPDLLHVLAPPTTRPALRGVYTGAAKTLLESNGHTQVLWLEVTGYCPCEKCCGPAAAGITASGKPVSYHDGVFAAADPALLPFGTVVRVPGYHDAAPAEVVDKGSAILGPRLDVFFPTHAQAEAWGRQWLPVTVRRD